MVMVVFIFFIRQILLKKVGLKMTKQQFVKTSKYVQIVLAISLSLFSIYPTFAKDCTDIPIFKQHLELDACNLERRIDNRFEELTDVKIIRFRYRPYDQFVARRILKKDQLGLLVFSAKYKGKTLNFKCSGTYIWHDNEHFSKGYFYLTMHHCGRRNIVFGGDNNPILFLYPIDVAKENWLSL